MAIMNLDLTKIIKKVLLLFLYSLLIMVLISSLVSLTNKKQEYIQKKQNVEKMLKSKLILKKN